jgi:hypothetical protein
MLAGWQVSTLNQVFRLSVSADDNFRKWIDGPPGCNGEYRHASLNTMMLTYCHLILSGPLPNFLLPIGRPGRAVCQ